MDQRRQRTAVSSPLLLSILLMTGCSAPEAREPSRAGKDHGADSTRFFALGDSLSAARARKDIPASVRFSAALIRSPYASRTFKVCNFAQSQRWEIMSRWLHDPHYIVELDSMLAESRVSGDTMRQFVLLTRKVEQAHWSELNTGRAMRFLEEAFALDPEGTFVALDHTLMDRYAEACAAVGDWRKAQEAALHMSRFGKEHEDCYEEYWGLTYASEAYGKLNLFDSCDWAIAQALSVMSACAQARADIFGYNALARQERSQSRFDRIPVLLDSTDAIIRRTGASATNCVYCVVEKAWWLLHEGRPRDAIELALALETAPGWKNDNYAFEEFHEVLDTAYHALGDFQNAYEHHAKLEALIRQRDLNKATANLANIESNAREQLAEADRREERQVEAARLHDAEMVRNGFIGGFALVALFAGIFLAQRNRISKARKRSDELLLNILPEEVANELKAKGHADAKHFDEATILFTDFKGFTEASERMTPQELVEELNTCFKAFDHIITARGVEKIKTIGDAYMCAGGLPVPASSTPAGVVHAALEMQAFMIARKKERDAQGKPAFEMRVGIHTGPVVAGIVGVKKFAYDIWGDTVNTASRMESSGEVGQVNISEATYALVREQAGSLFHFTPRGKVQAKGKGDMEMYFVEGKPAVA